MDPFNLVTIRLWYQLFDLNSNAACVYWQAFIVLSCSIAVSVNFSTFLVIGTTSPVTYQVLGHLKTCLILFIGYIILHEPFTVRNIVGILIAIFGMALYSYFSVQESKRKTANDVLPVSQVRSYFFALINSMQFKSPILLKSKWWWECRRCRWHRKRQHHFCRSKITKKTTMRPQNEMEFLQLIRTLMTSLKWIDIFIR